MKHYVHQVHVAPFVANIMIRPYGQMDQIDHDLDNLVPHLPL